MTSSLLLAHDLRVDAGGTPAVDGLDLCADGERALVLGAPRELFEATCGARAAARGTLLIDGVEATAALALGLVCGAPLDPPLPESWTPMRYATWSARLAGHARHDAERRAEEALRKLGALATAASMLKLAPPHLRRAAVVAGALATGAPTLVLEDPLLGLPGPVAEAFAAALLEALRGRSFILFAGRMSLGAPLAAAVDVALVLHGSRVAAQGRPAELAAAANAFALRIAGDGARFAELLAARGARVAPAADVARDTSGDFLFTVELGSSVSAPSTPLLFDVAHEANSTIVELCPIARAFV